MEEEILSWLESAYNNNNWPFFSINKIKKEFGRDGVAALNQLKKAGKIRRREGANYTLIELVK